MQRQIIDYQHAPSRIILSKIIYPIERNSKDASNSLIVLMQSQLFTFQLMLDLRRRLYLSIQQKRLKPIMISMLPAGMRDEQRQVNQIDSIIYAYFLPILYLDSYIKLFAYCWVKYLSPKFSLRLIIWKICQGLINQIKGTKKELKKNIIDYYSTTP